MKKKYLKMAIINAVCKVAVFSDESILVGMFKEDGTPIRIAERPAPLADGGTLGLGQRLAKDWTERIVRGTPCIYAEIVTPATWQSVKS